MKTTLQILCEIHSQQGGTIHQFNEKYGIDFLIDKPILDSSSYKLGNESGGSNKSIWKNKYIFYPVASFGNPTHQTKVNFILGFVNSYKNENNSKERSGTF